MAFAATPDQDKLWHLRNLGKAFYENPTTQREAVEQFRQALQLAPGSARERVNYGLALLRAGEIEKGVDELKKAQKEAPSIPHTWFNLGIVAKRNGDYAAGLEQMQRMVQLVPEDAKSHYNLGALWKLEGKLPEALREFEQAAKLDANLAGPHFQLYTAYRQSRRPEDAARELATFQEIKKRQTANPIPEDMEANNYTEILDRIDPRPTAEPLPEVRYADKGIASKITGIAALNGDLLAWSPTGIQKFHLGQPATAPLGIEDLKNIVSITPGDYDNDGLPDLCIITAQTATIYHNEKGSFAASHIALSSGAYEKAIWLDYDHDYDLDLMLLGEHSVLMRNNGDGSFTDMTASFPFVPGKAIEASNFALRPETAARDLLVSYQNSPAVVYKDLLNGAFQTIPLSSRTADWRNLVPGDFDHDSFLDLAALAPVGQGFLRNVDGQLNIAQFPDGVSVSASLAQGDWVRSSSSLEPREVASLGPNYAALAQDGSLHYRERIPSPNQHSLEITLHGVKNLKLANTAMVEVKAGALYQKKIYQGSPLFFPMGSYTEADTVRITWPNGLIQNEPQKKT